MNAVWARVRSELRRRVAATVWLMVFLGVAGGAVLGALAGARRTDTAYPRMRETTDASDALVSVERTGLKGFYDAVAELPGVAAVGQVAGDDLLVSAGSLPPEIAKGEDQMMLALVSVDGEALKSVGLPRVTSGRLPRPDRPDEAFANRFLADLGLETGSTIEVRPGGGDGPTPTGESVRLRIVGTGIFPNEVVPVAVNDTFPTVLLTPAFFDRYLSSSIVGQVESQLAFDGALVRLEPGADFDEFRAAIERLVAEHRETTGDLFLASEADRTPVIQRAIRPQVVALQMFAVLAGITALLLVGQALARQLYGDATEYPTLRSLGMTRRQLLAVGMLRTLLIGLGGSLLAILIAIATSPLMPLGSARLAEPAPGISVNAGLLALGGISMIVALLIVILVPALLHAGAHATLGAADPSGTSRPSRLADALSRSGAPTSMSAGVRMAVDPGRGATSAPVRSATVGAVLAIAALAATVSFGASLERLIDTPRLYGQNWDLIVDSGFGGIPPAPAVARLEALPEVEAYSAGIKGEVVIGETAVPTIGIDTLEGAVQPTMIEGRAPTAENEIALGTGTLRRIGRRVGDDVEVTIDQESRRMRIVGRPVFPQFGLGSFTPTGLGDGALTTAGILPAPLDSPGYHFFLVKLSDDAAPGAIDRAKNAITIGIEECEAGFCEISRTQRPGDVVNLSRVRVTQVVLAGLLALLATAAVGHALVTSVRRRGRDLAVLKTVGFLRRQVSATVAWQATTMMVISLLVGIPAGLAAGRVIWTGFADRLGVPAEPVVPMAVVLVGVVGSIVLANAAAAWPGRRAARLSPAVVLRDE